VRFFVFTSPRWGEVGPSKSEDRVKGTDELEQ
jgi:hypothetical protein